MVRPCQSSDHDFRRVYWADLRAQARTPTQKASVAYVLCCNCGNSPLADPKAKFLVNGDWPFTHKITAFYHDEVAGPSVEFTIEEEANA